MNQVLKLATAVLAGVAIGAAALNGLHAQAKPPAYSIVEVEVTDPTGFQEFAQRNAAGVSAAGGRFIVRRGRTVTSVGTPPKDVFVIAWASFDNATGYFNSPTFKDLIALRDRTAKVRLFHVEGLGK
jgi:uncharacterized protein (DUF1330 family)